MTETKGLPLTEHEASVLNSLRTFPNLDKSSQERVRAEVNNLRKTSKAFSEAFDVSISSIGRKPKPSQKEALLGSLKDIALHPITALKAKIGDSMLKRRNKAPVILHHPHKILAAIAEEWDFSQPKEDLIEIVRKLGAALKGVSYGNKLGMAAPQIGISKRVFVCQGAVCVNPTWTPPKFDNLDEGIEGCYSVPGKMFLVKRSRYGWARWKSVDGVPHEYKLSGKNAIVFQHELSHLDGKCCIDLGIEYKPPEKNPE